LSAPAHLLGKAGIAPLADDLWNTLLRPFATEALGTAEFEYGVQQGLTSVGFVLGSLLMAGLADWLREGQWLALSYLCMGILGVFCARATSIPVTFVLVALSGFMNAPSAVGRRLILLRYTEREVRGRVASAFFVSRDVVYLDGGLSSVEPGFCVQNGGAHDPDEHD
jgi:MFS family permease